MPNVRGKQNCAFCNQRLGVEREHVIPRSFFAPEDQGKRIFVGACRECNGKYAAVEEYARMYFALEWRGSEHSTAKWLLQKGGKAYRALTYNRAMLSSVVQNAFPTHLRTHGGIEIPGTYYAFEPDRAKLDLFIDKVVRGCFFAQTQEYLPRDYRVHYFSEDMVDLEAILASEPMQPLLATPIISAGNNVFQGRFARAVDDPMSTAWLMRFYEGATLLVYTRPTNAVLPGEATQQEPEIQED